LAEKKRRPSDRKKKPPRRAPKEPPKITPKVKCIVAVRLRGEAGVPRDVEATLNMLGLKRKHCAVLIYDRPDSLGMLRTAKDYVTWGEADMEILCALLEKRCRPRGADRLSDKYVKEKLQVTSIKRLVEAIDRAEIPLSRLREAGIPRIFHLHPPKGGFKRALKRPFQDRGELGDRGPEITALISRMI